MVECWKIGDQVYLPTIEVDDEPCAAMLDESNQDDETLVPVVLCAREEVRIALELHQSHQEMLREEEEQMEQQQQRGGGGNGGNGGTGDDDESDDGGGKPPAEPR